MSSLTIQPTTADAAIDGYAGREDTNYWNGELQVTSYSGGNGRTLLRFDFSELPEGATISSATLSLRYYNKVGTLSGRTYGAYRITQTGWVENQATWLSYATGSAWASAGGDFTTDNGATVEMPGSYGWVDWDVTELIQWFQENASEVVNLIIKDGTEGDETGAIGYFYSTEVTGGDDANRPKLAIEYTIGEYEASFEALPITFSIPAITASFTEDFIATFTALSILFAVPAITAVYSLITDFLNQDKNSSTMANSAKSLATIANTAKSSSEILNTAKISAEILNTAKSSASVINLEK